MWITQLYQIRTKKSELYLKLWEKILERRIAAHEQIISLTKTMRQMHLIDFDQQTGEAIRLPQILTTLSEFEQWYSLCIETVNANSTWLSAGLTRELYFLQDYNLNLYKYLDKATPDKVIETGIAVRDDFIDLSSQLEQLAFEFFYKDLSRLRLNDIREWHKYQPSESQKRIQATSLYSIIKQSKLVDQNAEK